MANVPFHPYEEDKFNEVDARLDTVESYLVSAFTHSIATTDTSEEIAIVGLVAADVVVATMHTGSRTVVKAVPAVDKVTITYSDAPTTADKVSLIAVKAF